MIIFRFYLPDPIALPTKEGGAELDVSGVWTFTPMSPETGINETGTSGTKLLQTPVRDLDVNPEAAMLALLGSATPKNFPAPPMRKRPHQCSTHSIGVLSSPTTTTTSCSSPISIARGHRSNLFLPSESLYNVPSTRSCGTNVSNNFHQRSVSALVPDHRRAISYVTDDTGLTSVKHMRSHSSQQQGEEIRPPALPPKLGSGVITRPAEMTSTPMKSGDTICQNVVPQMQFSFLQQLVQSSPNHPELLDTLRRHQIEPQPRRSTPKLSTNCVTRSPKVVTRSPSCAASLFNNHQRAVSMLEPMTSFNVETSSPATLNGRYVKHIRSSSTLAPTPELAANRRIVHQRSTSNVISRVASNVTPTRHRTTQQRHQLHKSTSNLSTNPDGEKKPIHQRSSSTPYEGFVV